MHIFCTDLIGEFAQSYDLFFCKIQLFLIELIVAGDSACVFVHDFLHGFFQFVDGKQTVLCLADLFVIFNDRLCLFFDFGCFFVMIVF